MNLFGRHGVWIWAGFLAFGLLLFVYPLLSFLLYPLHGLISPANLLSAIAQGMTPEVKTALANSVWLALLASIIAAPLGVWLAWWMERRAGWQVQLLGTGLWVLFLLPSYLLTTGWQIFLADAGLINSGFYEIFYSRTGIVFMFALKILPFATFVSRPTWASLGRELIDTMVINRVSRGQRFNVLLRLSLPGMAAAMVVGFIESVQEFGIPATLGAHIHLPILTYLIYEYLSTTPLDFLHAAGLSWLLVALAVLAAAAHLGLHHRYAAVLVHGRARRNLPVTMSRSESIVLSLVVLPFWGIGILLPSLSMIGVSLNVSFTVSASSLANSTAFAVLAASLSVVLALALTRLSQNRGARVTRLVDMLTIANMAIPGIVLAAAYLMAFNKPWLPLYGTPWLLVLGYVASFTPTLTRLLHSPVAQIDPRLHEAGRLFGLKPWVRLLDIDAVLLSRPLIRGWLMAFGTLLFELPLSALLYPPGYTPLGVAVVQLNQSVHYAQAAQLALLGVALTVGVVLIVGLLARHYVLRPMEVTAS